MPSLIYNAGKRLIGGEVDWASKQHRFKLLLATSDYAPKATHKFVSVIEGELSGGGYGRQELVGRSIQTDDATGRVDFMADQVAFKKLSSSQRYQWIVLYRVMTSDEDADLLCALDMGSVSLRGIMEHTIKWDKQSNGRVFSMV